MGRATLCVAALVVVNVLLLALYGEELRDQTYVWTGAVAPPLCSRVRKVKKELHVENGILRGHDLFVHHCDLGQRYRVLDRDFHLAQFASSSEQIRVNVVGAERMVKLEAEVARIEVGPALIGEATGFHQHSHILFDITSNIYGLFVDNRVPFDNNTIFLHRNLPHHLDRRHSERVNGDGTSEMLPPDSSDFFFSMLTPRLRSYAHLVQSSASEPVLFKNLFLGIPKVLDQYHNVPTVAEAEKKHPRWQGFLRFLMKNVEVDAGEIEPVLGPETPRVVVIRRVKKRLILNDEELARMAAAFLPAGSRVTLMCFDNMSLADQIRVVRNTDVLFGVEGTGFANAFFLPRCATTVEYNTYGTVVHAELREGHKARSTEKGVNFRNLAHVGGPANTICAEQLDKSRISYPANMYELGSSWHVDATNIDKSPFYPRMDQDMTIDPTEFERLIKRAVEAWRTCHATDEFYFGQCDWRLCCPEEDQFPAAVTPPTTLECVQTTFVKDDHGVVVEQGKEE